MRFPDVDTSFLNAHHDHTDCGVKTATLEQGVEYNRQVSIIPVETETNYVASGVDSCEEEDEYEEECVDECKEYNIHGKIIIDVLSKKKGNGHNTKETCGRAKKKQLSCTQFQSENDGICDDACVCLPTVQPCQCQHTRATLS